MNREEISKINTKCLNTNCNDVGLEYEGTLCDLIGDVLYKTVNVTQLKILDQYHNMIQQKVRGALKDPNCVDDAISYVSTEILKAYKFRYKYKDGAD